MSFRPNYTHTDFYKHVDDVIAGHRSEVRLLHQIGSHSMVVHTGEFWETQTNQRLRQR